ncbi:MAG TPA: tripartite tricarboxylate transporter substrate binding protein [Methylomirabilota bacterium]|nr:tripartite tricarboxylate transporter substrate binding protein [Methylomirabilota bacterium]
MIRPTVALAVLLASAPAGWGQTFPAKPIELIIPFGAGGSADIEGRIIAKAAEKLLGVPVVPINKPGAGGALAYTHVKTAPPDGYTVAWNSTSLLTTANLGTLDFPWDALDHVARVSTQAMPLAVRADAAWKTFPDFLAHARANPGKVRIGNAGHGSGTHFAALALTEATGIKVIHAPLGSGKRIPSLLRGEVEMISVPTPEIAAHVRAGEVRILAVPSEAADPAFPGVPTLRQAGVPVAMELFRGFSVPKGTPAAVVDKLAEAFQKAAQDEAFKQAGANGGYIVAVQGPAAFRKYLEEQNALIADLVKKAGLKK